MKGWIKSVEAASKHRLGQFDQYADGDLTNNAFQTSRSPFPTFRIPLLLSQSLIYRWIYLRLCSGYQR